LVYCNGRRRHKIDLAMPKITNIKQQVKNKDRISVYVDGKYSFSLSAWQFGSAGLKLGEDIAPKRVEELRKDSDFGKMHDRALMWLMLRPRSIWEVEDYLRRKVDDEAVQKKLLMTFQEKEYIDDEDFAERWVANRRLLKPVSKLKLRQELLKKRVPKEIIDQTLEADETNEVDVLLELIEKKRRITRYQDNRKLMEYLARQGFRYGDIKAAMEQTESS